MKSMKLASGFAISTLAMAIAGTAVAQEATTEVDFTGSVKVNTVLDLEDETRINGLPGFAEYSSGAEGNDDWFNLEATWSVTHGPFSGDLIVGYVDQESAGGQGVVEIDNLIVAEGPISFGQVGSVVNTVGLVEGFTDYRIFEIVGQDELDLTDGYFDVEAAFRYSLSDFGLAVQAEGKGGDFGIGAALTQDIDVATLWADFQYREEVGADGMTDGETFFGVGAQVTPVEMVSLTAVVNSESIDEQTAAVLRLDADVTDTVAVYAQYADVDLGDNTFASDDSDFVLVGGTVGFAPITLELGYQAWLEDAGEGIVLTKASYADGPYGAFAELNVGLGGAETVVSDYLEVVLGADYTTDSGIVYGAEYTFVDLSEAGLLDDTSDSNEFELFAQYSF